MSTPLVLIIVLLLLILGANRIGAATRNASERIKEDTFTGFRRGYEEVMTPSPTTEKTPSIVVKKEVERLTNAFFNYALMEGWDKKSTDQELKVTAIINPIVSDMLDELNEHVKLEYHLPALQVGVYSVDGVRDELADEVQKIKTRGYTRFVNYNGYLIGYSKSQRN